MKKLILMAALAVFAVQAFAFVENAPYLTLKPYCDLRQEYPLHSPFTQQGQPDPMPEMWLAKNPPYQVGSAKEITFYNNFPGSWRVYKSYESQEIITTTQDAGCPFRYYNHTISEWSLGYGLRQRVQSGANGVYQPWTDTGWVAGDEGGGQLFNVVNPFPWDNSQEQSVTTTGDGVTTFTSSRNTRVQWKVSNMHPELMPSSGEVETKWAGENWPLNLFYEVSMATGRLRSYTADKIYYYPQGAPAIYINNPQDMNTSCYLGYPNLGYTTEGCEVMAK